MTTALVIGADKGIGFEIVKQLAARGDTVWASLLGADASFGTDAVHKVANVDVVSKESLARMARQLREAELRIDVLYHVAGVMTIDTLGEIDYDRMVWEFKVNAIGPLRTVETLLPFLHAGSRVGIVTSRVGSLTDNSSGGQYSYRASKCAANMIGLNLHHDLKKRGVAVRMLHPGMVKTDLVKDYKGDFAYITPEAAATGLIARMDELTLETAGEFRHGNGQLLPW